MGIAHGVASAVILRAEGPAYSWGAGNQPLWVGLSVLNRAVGCVSLGVAQGWYIGGPLALKNAIVCTG